MPPQDGNDSAPPSLEMVEAKGFGEKQLVTEDENLYDFLKAPSRSTDSDATESTQVSSSTSSSVRNSAAMAVMGIYTRDKVPREEELPKDYGLSHVKKDQVMCRRRMKTLPKHLEEEEEEELEAAMFVPEKGLVGPIFFHADLEEHDESDDEDEQVDPDWKPRIYEERAVLFQAMEHYEQLLDEPTLSKYFKTEENDDEVNSESPEDSKEADDDRENLQAILENPRFGEQIIVQGMNASQIAVGDVFEIEGGLSPLKLEITSPRLCCAWVDKRQGSPFGLAGVKRFCNKNGLGGFFARVLVAGELRDEMKFVRTSHPHPKWTLAYISEALYGEGPKTYLMAGWAHWQRSKQELKELCEVEQLGLYEWKEEAEYILKHWRRYRPDSKKNKKPKKLTMADRIRPFATKMRLDTIFGSDVNQFSNVSPQLLLQIVVALIACFAAMHMVSAALKTPDF
jgi:MOSC domain-containing protein YiiM